MVNLDGAHGDIRDGHGDGGDRRNRGENRDSSLLVCPPILALHRRLFNRKRTKHKENHVTGWMKEKCKGKIKPVAFYMSST